MRTILDPFGGVLDSEGGAFSKTVHSHFENGHRVVVHSPGHHTHGLAGVITDDRNDNRLEVRLDSGHVIHAHESDLVPEALAAVGESVKILKAAVASGAVSNRDQAIIAMAFEKIASGSYFVGPLGETDYDSPFHTLQILSEMYASADASEVLAKRASRGTFKVGDAVRDTASGRKGKITRLDVTHADIDYGNGITGICLLGYLEAA